MTDAERQAVLDTLPAAAVPEVLDAGFTHRDGGDGRGFAAGGALDQMAPGGVLAMVTDRVWANGLDRLSDDELIGVMAAARRGASRQAALELAAIDELAARRAGADGCPGEHVQEEVAAALTLTGRAAASQVGLAAELARLPGVGRALAAGRIDVDKAEVFTGQLLLLDLIAANAIAGLVLPRAPRMTTGRLRKALADQIMDYDPAGAGPPPEGGGEGRPGGDLDRGGRDRRGRRAGPAAGRGAGRGPGPDRRRPLAQGPWC